MRSNVDVEASRVDPDQKSMRARIRIPVKKGRVCPVGVGDACLCQILVLWLTVESFLRHGASGRTETEYG